MHWDVFCKVIDNYGDVGVCWRLCQQLAARGVSVRLWMDDLSALAWMAPLAVEGHTKLHRIQVFAWTDTTLWPEPGEVVIEAFGCELPPAYVAAMARRQPRPSWINLEYLSAESYAKQCHLLPSPVMSGPGKGLTKHFFYPGFVEGTGGLLREADVLQRQKEFDRFDWLNRHSLSPEAHPQNVWVSLFCYEPPVLPELLLKLAAHGRTQLLVTTGRATAAVQTAISEIKRSERLPDIDSLLSISYLKPLTQIDFDHLLWACDLNFVRGEDSLVRALWSGKPLVWQIYPQSDNAHHDKLNAFLDMLAASPPLRQWHETWNGLRTPSSPEEPVLPSLDALLNDITVAQARQRLLKQVDLVSQLMAFVERSPQPPT